MALHDELVLAVPTATLFAERKFQGLEAGGREFLQRIFAVGDSRYIPRSSAESDPSWKQIIPYVVLHVGDRLFTYRRGKSSGEARLAALHSVGVGGHVNPGDESLFAAPGVGAYEAALERELAEEVAVAPEIVLRRRTVAVINDDSVEVGRVHFGIVHCWELARPEVAPRERKIAEPRFLSLDQLRGPKAPELETWSRLVVEHWHELSRNQ